MITFANEVASYEDSGPLGPGCPSYEKWAATQRNPSRKAWARVTLESVKASYERLPAAKQKCIKAELEMHRNASLWRRILRYFDINSGRRGR